MRLQHLSKYMLILGLLLLLIGCDSSTTPNPDAIERAYPAPVGSWYTFDQYALDTLGNIIPDYPHNATFTDSIVSNDTTLVGKNNMITFRRTARGNPIYYDYYYYNFETNGDLSVYFGYPLIDTVWTIYPIESRIPTIIPYYDSSTRSGYVTKGSVVIEYDSSVSITIKNTILKGHKMKTRQVLTTDTKTGYQSVSVLKSYLIFVPSIGYIVEWRTEPSTVNGYFDGNYGGVWILKDYHIN